MTLPVLAAVLFAACSTEEPKPAPAPATAATADEGKPPDVKFDLQTMQQGADQVALVPSPAEMQRALEAAGISARLATMVADRTVDLDSKNNDQVAVRTGVVLAQLLLTAKEADTKATAARLDQVHGGLAKVGAKDDILGTVEDLKARVANEAVPTDDLIKELDELSGAMVPEMRETSERMVPLIQAGSWVEGAHLVSGALIAEKKFDKASALLRQPAVVDYFLQYLQEEGKERAPDEVVDQLEKTLTELRDVASKDPMSQEDVQKIHDATGSVLALM